MAFTKPLTVNGSQNLRTLLVAAGYTGNPLARQLKLYNSSGSVTMYVHYLPDGTNPPGTGTDGIPYGTAATDAARLFEMAFDGRDGFIDLGLVWLHTVSSIPIKAMVVSA